ncbi:MULTISPECIES: hypothetical protein [unclassified Flavonifractor]|uniref:hypothetical protein n=1 Tax=Flavonifractor sp. An92 TaxID=1965666 RepID=UPI0013021A19|nr:MULTISPECIES: hypothetical protein [unclassified Flavonifractor]
MAKVKVPGGHMVGVIPEGFDPNAPKLDTKKPRGRGKKQAGDAPAEETEAPQADT